MIALPLGVDVGIAVDLGGRGLEEPRPIVLRGHQAVVGTAAADHRRPDGVGLVVRRRGGTGEIVDLVERSEIRAPNGVTMSCSMISKRPLDSRALTFSRRPVWKLSMQVTRLPSPTRRSQRWEPRNPAPPVTTICLLLSRTNARDKPSPEVSNTVEPQSVDGYARDTLPKAPHATAFLLGGRRRQSEVPVCARVVSRLGSTQVAAISRFICSGDHAALRIVHARCRRNHTRG